MEILDIPCSAKPHSACSYDLTEIAGRNSRKVGFSETSYPLCGGATPAIFYFVAQVPTIGHCATRTLSSSRVDLMPAMTVAISSAVATRLLTIPSEASVKVHSQSRFFGPLRYIGVSIRTTAA